MKASDVLKYAYSFIGVRYRWGGNNPVGGFDCGGLCCELLKASGILHYNEDLSAQDLALRLAKNYERCEPRPGAILFFGNVNKIGHVAIALDEKLMIEAGGGDQAVNNIEMADIKNAFVRIRPISIRKDYLFALNVFPE